MSRKLGPNCGYPQFRVIFAQKLGWCWVVGVNLRKLGLNNPNLPPILPPNCGKIVVKLVLWLGLGVVLHILIGLGLWLGVSKHHFAHPWRGYVGAWVRGRKLLEAELTMTMKIKVINIDENIPKIHFGHFWDPSRIW